MCHEIHFMLEIKNHAGDELDLPVNGADHILRVYGGDEKIVRLSKTFHLIKCN